MEGKRERERERKRERKRRSRGRGRGRRVGRVPASRRSDVTLDPVDSDQG